MIDSIDSIRRIVLCFPVTPEHELQLRGQLDELKQDPTCPLAHDVEIINAGQERINETLPTADIFIGHAKVPVNWDRVLAAGRLRWIQSSAAGLDHCLVPGVIAEDAIQVSSAAGLFAPQVAEQTFCLLFGLLRQIRRFEKARGQRDFTRLPTDDLRGKTVGLVGLGGNGRAIANMLAPWDVRMIATDYYPIDCPTHVEALWPHDQLPRLCDESDIVILTLPLNQSTHHLFDHAMLSLMRRRAYLINVARGPVIDESALTTLLLDEHFAGVGLDVTECEPLPETSRLWDHDRVLITPHVGAQSARRVDDTVDLACQNLQRFFRGLSLINHVDKHLGFPHPSSSWSAYRRDPKSFDA